MTSYLCREPVVEGIPEVHQGKGKIFVKEIAEKFAHAIIGPAAMDQEQTPKIVELREGKVTVEHGLHSLRAADANPNVGSCKRNPRNFSAIELVCWTPSLGNIKGKLRSCCTNPLLTFGKLC